MFESDEIFRKSVITAGNHIERAKEGTRLLAEGKSLAEMSTPITGLTEEEMGRRRMAQIKLYQKMDEEELRRSLRNVERGIEIALKRDVQGTSELYWQRIIIKDILGEL